MCAALEFALKRGDGEVSVVLVAVGNLRRHRSLHPVGAEVTPVGHQCKDE